MWLKANNQPLTDQDKIKYAVAEELGLLQKVLNYGWAGLTTLESGKIGGVISSKKRAKA